MRSGYSQKKSKRNRAHFAGYSQEIKGIVMLGFGILALLSFYFTDSVGPFGRFIKNMLLGLFGTPSIVIPPVIVILSLFILFGKIDAIFSRKVLYAAVLVLLFSALMHTAVYYPGKYVNMNIFRCLRAFYLEGADFKGGGAVGGILATPFLKLFNILGTIIVLTTLAIIDIILLTDISPAYIIRGIRNRLVGIAGSLAQARKNKSKRKEKVKDICLKETEVSDNTEIEDKTEQVPRVIDFTIERKSRNQDEKVSEEDGEKENREDPVKLIIKDFGKKEEKAPEKFPDISVESAACGDYVLPPVSLLKEPAVKNVNMKNIKNAALEGAVKLEETLASFGVEAKVINVTRGPSVTRYELRPGIGVQVKKIAALSDDIALHLASPGVRIEAPIPGKDAIGIEVPNKEINTVTLREIIESEEFVKCPSKLAFALGRDISGDIIVADVAKMPHVLIAGATGAGKSVCINNLILSILFKARPDEVKLILVDPKVVELGIYNGVPHLLLPVVTNPKKAAGALNWAVQEMMNRYSMFSSKGVKDINGYNALVRETGEEPEMPQVVIIIDELADLMMASPHEVEDAICRLAQMARAAGMHLVIATQRPSVDVITGLIKANIPSRISFAVSSQFDSRTILDMAGAEKLLGRGDMLYFPAGIPKPIRVQGAYHTEKEIEAVVEFVKEQVNAEYDSDLLERINSEVESAENDDDWDELLPQAIELVVDMQMASVSLIQRKFRVGYARAARIVDQMEARGIVGPREGSKPRQVLVSRQQWQEMQMQEES